MPAGPSALHLPPPPLPVADPSAVAVLRSVTKSYGETMALRDVDLILPTRQDGKGGIVGVLGPNGAGKSTLFRLLLGLERADQGEVEVLGRPQPDASLDVLAQVGYMPEDDSLFPLLTGLEQVVHAGRLCGLPKVDATSRAHQALDLVQLTELRYRTAATWSLGQRQRLRLAMAIVHGPRLLLLDEPTAGLDPNGRAQMLDLIAEIGQQGVAVLLSTHVLADVEHVCDHVVLMSRGQVSFVGPMARFRQGTSGSAFRVRVAGPPGDLQLALQRRGFTAQVEGGDVVVAMQPEETAALWQAAAEAGVGVRRFAKAEEEMAQAFVRHLRLDDPARRPAQLPEAP